MKRKVIAAVCLLVMLAAQTVLGAEFSDVPGSHWAHSVISELSDKGVINGMGNGIYAPDGTLTKAQFIKLLTCALGDFDSAKNYKPMFLDTEAEAWYTPYISCGVQNSIIKKSDDFFYPDSPVTRGEAAVWIVNGIGVDKNTECTFSDVTDATEKKAVAIAQSKGIINGYEDGTFKPQNTLTRAEAAALISRTMKNAPKFGQIREDAANEIVMKDSVKHIAVGENNKIKKADNKQKTITFSSPDETVKALAQGDIIYITENKDGGEAVAKVESVKKSGSDIVVKLGSPSLSDVVESIDISAVITPSAEELSKNSNISNVRASGSLSGSSVSGLNIDAEAQINPEAEWDGGKLVWKVPATGSAATDFTLETASYKTKKGAYASLDMNMRIFLDVMLSGENLDAEFYAKAEVDSNINAVAGYCVSKEAEKAIELPSIEVSVAGPVTVEITPYLVATASGKFKVEATATLNTNIGCEFKNGEFETWSDCAFDSSLEADAEGFLEVGPRISADFGLKDFELFGIEFDAPEILNFTADMGLGISGKTVISQKAGVSTEDAYYEGHQNTPDENGVIHNCVFCVSGEIYSYDKFTFGLSDDLNELFEDIFDKKLTYESDKMTFTFSPWYFSIGSWGSECELALCPHKLVRVSGRITEKETGDDISGALINAQAQAAYKDYEKENLADAKSAVSQSTGKYEIFLEPGVWNALVTEGKHKDTQPKIYVPTDKEITKNIAMELKDIKVSGYVKDAKTGAAVFGATVTIGDKSTASAASGYYELEVTPLTKHSVAAGCDKYKAYASEIQAQKDEILLDISLEPDDGWQDAYRAVMKKSAKYQLVELADIDGDNVPEMFFGTTPGSGGFSMIEFAYTYKNGKVETISYNSNALVSFSYERYINAASGQSRVEGSLYVRSGYAESSSSRGTAAINGNKYEYSPIYAYKRTVSSTGQDAVINYTYYDYSSGFEKRITEADYKNLENNLHNGWVKDNTYKCKYTTFGKKVTDAEINKLYEEYENSANA